jgi:hypothetical protein
MEASIPETIAFEMFSCCGEKMEIRENLRHQNNQF